MKFSVVFQVEGADRLLVETKLGSAGLDLLDSIRDEYPQLKDVPLERYHIDDRCPIDGSFLYVLTISEEYARKTNHFAGRSNLDVYVPGDSFGRFVTLDVSIAEKTELSGGLSIGRLVLLRPVKKISTAAVVVKYKFDDAALLNAWEAAGFPTEWKICGVS